MWCLLIKILKSVVWIRTLIRPGKGYLVKKTFNSIVMHPFVQVLDPDQAGQNGLQKKKRWRFFYVCSERPFDQNFFSLKILVCIRTLIRILIWIWSGSSKTWIRMWIHRIWIRTTTVFLIRIRRRGVRLSVAAVQKLAEELECGGTGTLCPTTKQPAIGLTHVFMTRVDRSDLCLCFYNYVIFC